MTVATVPRMNQGYPSPVFQICLHDRIQVMDPEGFMQWMQEQTWPRREKEAVPVVLLPDNNDGEWLAVSFLCERVRGGLMVVAYTRQRALHDTDGNILRIIQPFSDGNA